MSDYLFAMPSTIDGVASVLDLFGIYPEYNDSKTVHGADMRGYFADFKSLHNDAEIALNLVTKNVQKK